MVTKPFNFLKQSAYDFWIKGVENASSYVEADHIADIAGRFSKSPLRDKLISKAQEKSDMLFVNEYQNTEAKNFITLLDNIHRAYVPVVN